MCGRYILALAAAVEKYFELARSRLQYEVSYNVAPTQKAPVVRLTDGERAGDMLRWGLVPFFARGVPGKYSTINAQLEKLESGPSWRGPWKRGQRCIVTAGGFYEWHVNEVGQKHPYFIHLTNQPVFGFAGLWDRSVAEDGTAIESCAIITMPGNDLMRSIHNTGNNPHRMPAILSPGDFEAWLGGAPADAREALRPYPAESMSAYRVSTRVNSPRNNDERLIDAVDDPPPVGHTGGVDTN